MDLDEIVRQLSTVLSDKALLTSVRARRPDLVKLCQQFGNIPVRPDGAPDFERLTAGEFTVFDNYVKSDVTRKRGALYSATVKLFTQQFPVNLKKQKWKGSCKLHSPTFLLANVHTLVCSDATKDVLTAFANDGYWAGALNVNVVDLGTCWFDEHVAAIKIDGATITEAMTYWPGNVVKWPGLKLTNSDGSKFAGKIIGQSRHSPLPQLTSWRTGIGINQLS